MWFSSIWFSFNIENWKSKLHINRDFQCLILKNWKSKIYNLNFQFLLLRKVKLNIILQYFENQKLKIENGQLVVLTFCFQFPPPKIQAINNSSVANSARNGVTAGEIQNKNRFLIFVFMKNKIANRPKIPVMEGEGKTGSGATANKMAVVLKWTSVPCLRRAVFRGKVKPTAI